MIETEIRNHVKNQVWIASRIQVIACVIANHRNILMFPASKSYEDDFELTGTEVTANFCERYSGCTDHESVTFPLHYLWTENYMELEIVYWAGVIAEKQRLAELQHQKQAIIRQQEFDERDRREWERLKLKFAEDK